MTRQERRAASGMIEVLILVSVAVVGAGALAAWFSGSYDVLQETGCTAWMDAHEISDGSYWIQATIRNTGDHPIREYHVMVGDGDAPAASSHAVWEPGQTAVLEFVVAGAGDGSHLLPARVTALGGGGSALCGVVTP